MHFRATDAVAGRGSDDRGPVKGQGGRAGKGSNQAIHSSGYIYIVTRWTSFNWRLRASDFNSILIWRHTQAGHANFIIVVAVAR